MQDGCSQKGHCGVVTMMLEAKADVNSKTNVSHAVAVFVYSADSMVECVHVCHLCGLSSGECTINCMFQLH